MTKAEVVQEIANSTGLDKAKVAVIIDAMMETTKQSMINGNNIYFRGFGTFLLKKQHEKLGRNINNGTTVLIPACTIPAFKPAEEFLNEVRIKVKVKK